MKTRLFLILLCLLTAARAQTAADVKNLSVNGGVEDGKVRLVIEGLLGGPGGDRSKLIFATASQHSIKATHDKVNHRIALTLDVLQGEPTELPLTLSGPGDIRQVTGEALQDWSVRQEANGTRTLVLRPRKGDKPLTQLAVVIVAESELKTGDEPQPVLTLAPPQPALFNGFVKVESVPELEVQNAGATGVLPIAAKFLPEAMRSEIKPDDAEPLAFQFHGTAYAMPLKIAAADPDTRQVVLRDFQLAGTLAGQNAAFILTAIAHVKNPQGGSLDLLGGSVALTELASHPNWKITTDRGRFVVRFAQPGEYPLVFKFNATVRQNDGWNAVDFLVARSALQPIVLRGLAADTQFQFAGAAKPVRKDADFASFLSPDGSVKLAWKAAATTTEGKLFYSAEVLSQVSVGPGLMRQVALLDGKVMQGELDRLTVLLRGAGEVTRVQGEQVLSWKVEPGQAAGESQLVVQFNQPQKGEFAIQVQTQTPIGAFPQTVDALQLRPDAATRFAGHVRIVNEGAVRLEVVQARGLSQISPEQFPESDATKAAFSEPGEQRFAYRFSGGDFALRIQADQILPEITVSQILAYHLSEKELSIDAEIELDIREAPLRELLLRVPKGYAVARLGGAGIVDHFLTDREEPGAAELRLVYGQPVSGRQVVQLRLELNQAPGAAEWVLPQVAVTKAKSVRGHIAVSADAGFRLTAGRTQALTEIATAFFPRKVAGIQAAFRLSDPAWQATVGVERLPQSIQADAFHLFSIGEGVAYGSSVLNFAISGAPVTAFKVELSDEYFNVEFAGKDLRNWQKTEGGYVVQLHTPLAGAYTLLASYERPFKAQGETLTFTGARPLDAQSEQGHTLVISAHQFQVKPQEVSPGLLPLEPGEVPSEYRLFFDAPILAAYRYTARPFNLKLALSPLAQGDSLSQVVDRAVLNTRISKEGQVITSVRYFVKSRGHASFRLTVAEGTQLWSATVNGAAVVPVKDGTADLLPLPQQADPSAVLTIDLKLALRAKDADHLKIATPALAAPVMLAEWKVEPDAGRRLTYRDGSLTPAGGASDNSGFAGLARVFGGRDAAQAVLTLVPALALFALAVLAWRFAAGDGVNRFSSRFWMGLLVGGIAMSIAFVALSNLGALFGRHHTDIPRELAFVAPVQPAGQVLSVEVGNEDERFSLRRFAGLAWPAALAVVVWVYGWRSKKRWCAIAGWTLLAWAALSWPNGAPAFLVVLAAFFVWSLAIPALRRLFALPRAPEPAAPPPPPSTGGAVVASVLIFCSSLAAPAQEPAPAPRPEPVVAETVTQQIRVEEKFAVATAKVRWQAVKGQRLPLVFEPAVLTNVTHPPAAMKLVQTRAGNRTAHHVLALEGGAFDIEFQYQLPVVKKETESGITLPAQFGLINRLTLTLAGLDVDVVAPQAVAIERKAEGKDTVAALILAPVNDVWVGWKPRSRDVAREKAAFFTEVTQLYIPTAGAIEGLHYADIRPAQGELSEIIFNIPKGATITDVMDPAVEETEEKKPEEKKPAPVVSQWRFDPDTGKLRVQLSPPLSRPFALLIRSQIATGPLPLTQSVGLVSVEGAAGQIGLLGFGTGNEVQLDSVTAEALSPINLEDFPDNIAPVLEEQVPGLTVRRAFRYADIKATAAFKASAVQPDVRVDSQATLSLGEDRVLLAVNAGIEITRAGIFRLSFALPAGMDVESISGKAVSHWTELKTDAARVITLHLRGRTEGEQSVAISLTGPGLKAAKAWAVPQLTFREASKQRGTFLVVPEQGMRLQVATRDSITQLDPQKSGIKQKGVLAFRVLQAPWSLALDVEQVDPWVQVTGLQHATVGEALIKVAANLQFQIENTGLRALQVALPANAENVRFHGEQVADFLPVQNAAKEGMQMWEVKLHRRVIGSYLLRATYQTPLPADAPAASLRGIEVANVNLQRGFVTVQSGGRLQIRVETPPAALQPAEWQSIPRLLQQEMTASSASFAYRLVEPAFQLPLKLERHEATKLLPARVDQINFTSVIADDGAVLTQVRLDILPGDKRLLHLTLPKDASFWFAFVNQSGVWPWREQDKILLPLEAPPHGQRTSSLEFFFSSRIRQPATASHDLQLLAPKFDLPLENITWRVFLNETWQVKKWTGSMQFQLEQVVSAAGGDARSYLEGEASQLRDKIKAAEQMLALGNSALQQGNPKDARRAFESAYGLSQHDNAFNEDARVQLHNLKLQQALIGLNVRQSGVTGEPDALTGKLHAGAGKEANYTQQTAKQIIERNTADENAAFVRLAERLIQQQDAAVTNPAMIRVQIPERGRMLIFKRAVAVDDWADLEIGVKASAHRPASWPARAIILAVIALLFALCVKAAAGRKTAPRAGAV